MPKSRGGVRGAGFSFPRSTPLSSVLSLFSSGPLPAGFDRESESHPRSPIPRLTTHPFIHSTLLSWTSLCPLFQKLPLRFFAHNLSLPSSQWTFACSALACYLTKLGNAPTSWFRLVTDRLPRKTSGCGPGEIALMFWQLFLRHAFFFFKLSSCNSTSILNQTFWH